MRVMGGRDLEPSRTHRVEKFDLSDSISASFRSLNGHCPFQKTKGPCLLVPQNQFTMVTHCRHPTLEAHKHVLSYILIYPQSYRNNQGSEKCGETRRGSKQPEKHPLKLRVRLGPGLRDRYQSTSYSSGTSCCFIHRSGVWASLLVCTPFTDGDHKSRTSGKYRSIAVRNLCRYCLGVIIVGSPLPAPPRNADSLTQLSSFLSHV